MVHGTSGQLGRLLSRLAHRGSDNTVLAHRSRCFSVTLLMIVVCMIAASAAGPRDVAAQSLAEMYRNARFRVKAEQILDRIGWKADPMPVQSVPYATDSLRDRMARVFAPEHPEPEPVEALHVSEWQLIPKLGRTWFEKEFGSEGWSFLGSNDLTRLDTTFTREVRARLQSEFGAPTQTIADRYASADRGEQDFVQFEYWFVLNDSIALKVMDVNGPFERGVVVAAERRYREMLPELRDVLGARIMQNGEKAAYADYYYLPDQRMWFLTGFDGRRYFVDRISKPNLRLGRPLLEKVLDR